MFKHVIFCINAFAFLCVAGFSPLLAAPANPFNPSADAVWHEHLPADVDLTSVANPLPATYRAFHFDHATMTLALSGGGPIQVLLPLADGSYQVFDVKPSEVWPAADAGMYAGVSTLHGVAVGNAAMTVAITISIDGLDAFVRGAHGSTHIERSNADSGVVVVYSSDVAAGFNCFCDDHAGDAAGVNPFSAPIAENCIGDELRKFRLGIAAAGEYTAANGGTVASALTAIAALVNNLNLIYERDMSVRFILATDNSIIFTSTATDPFTTTPDGAELTASDTTLDGALGSTGYDVGITLGSYGGGLAQVASICSASKGRAVSSSNLEVVAHELGHAFGASHTFSGDSGSCVGNGTLSAAWEPGAGYTLMAYNGICADDNYINNTGGNFFHWFSMQQMNTVIASSSCYTNCPVTNSIPVVSWDGCVVPVSTPFELTATATDADGDALTYSWEEADLAPSFYDLNTTADDGQIPLYRSYAPRTSPSRSFPDESYVLSGTIPSGAGERLHIVPASREFVVTVRDGNGGTCSARDTVEIAGTAPFMVTGPTGTAFCDSEITWDVAGTDAAPFNESMVNILLSSDGGASFSSLANGVVNDGSENIILPDMNIAGAILRIEAASGCFYNISEPFDITPCPTNCFFLTGNQILLDNGCGRVNGIPAPGEEGIQFQLEIQNVTNIPALNVTACIVSLTPTATFDAAPVNVSASLAAGDAVFNDPFILDVSTAHPCGDPILYEVTIKGDKATNTLSGSLATDTDCTTEPLSIQCPPDITIGCTDSSETNVTGVANAATSCGSGVGFTNLFVSQVTSLGNCSTEQICFSLETCPPGGGPVDIGGITVMDNNTAGFRHTFPAGTMLSDGGVICYLTEELDPNGDGDLTDNTCPGGSVWNNGGDCIIFASVPAGLTAIDSYYLAVPDADCAGIATMLTDEGGGVYTSTGSGQPCLDCGDVVVSYSDVTNNMIGNSVEYQITRTWEASIDCLGNSVSCVQLITASCQCDPVFVDCPDPCVVDCADDISTNAYPAPQTITTCGADSTLCPTIVSFMDVTNTIYLTYAYTVDRIWTATNPCSSVTAVCSQRFTVVCDPGTNDFCQFFIECPTNITIDCLLSGVSPEDTGAPVTTNNCFPFFERNLWLNEIHYDNIGADTNEFLEIAGPAGTDLGNYTLVAYDASGMVVATSPIPAGTIIPSEPGASGFGVVPFTPADIDPAFFDNNNTGIALIDNTFGVTIFFVSYEGVISAVQGPANCKTSIDLGQSEDDTTLPDNSIELSGTGNMFMDFVYVQGDETFGEFNTSNQTITASTKPPVPTCEEPVTTFIDTIVENAATPEPFDYDIVREWTVSVDCIPTDLVCTQVITVDCIITNVQPCSMVLDCSEPVDIDCFDDPNPAFLGFPTPIYTCSNLFTGLFPPILNEIHYDNNGVDIGEFLEFYAPAGTDLSLYELVSYDGSNMMVQATVPLSGIVPDQQNGFGTVAFTSTVLPPEFFENVIYGIALVEIATANVEWFVSFQGGFCALNGPANGLCSNLVPLQENGTTPIGNSLYLTGVWPALMWTGPDTSSPGQVNDGQTFPITFDAESICTNFTLEYTDSTNVFFGDQDDYQIVREWSGSNNCVTVGAVCTQLIGVVCDFPDCAIAFSNCVEDLFVNVCAFMPTTTDPADLGSPEAFLFACEAGVVCTATNVTFTDMINTNFGGPNDYIITRSWEGTADCATNIAYCTQRIEVVCVPPNCAIAFSNCVEDLFVNVCAFMPTTTDPADLGSPDAFLFACETGAVCAVTNVTFTDMIDTNFGGSNDYIITRSWEGTADCATNIAYCTQRIEVVCVPPNCAIAFSNCVDVCLDFCGASTNPVDMGGPQAYLLACQTGAVCLTTDVTFTDTVNLNYGDSNDYEIIREWVASANCATNTAFCTQRITVICEDTLDCDLVMLQCPTGRVVDCEGGLTPLDLGFPTVIRECEPLIVKGLMLNELRYDHQNPAADGFDFIEIAGPANADLSFYTFLRFDSNGFQTAAIQLDGVITNLTNGFGILSFGNSQLGNSTNIFTDAPAAIAVVELSTTSVAFFVSWESTITAVNGPLVGQTANLLPISMSSTEFNFESIQLIGGPGEVAEDFSYVIAEDSIGEFNTDQSFTNYTGPVVPTCEVAITNVDTIVNSYGDDNDYQILREWIASAPCVPYTVICTQRIDVVCEFNTNACEYVLNCPMDLLIPCGEADLRTNVTGRMTASLNCQNPGLGLFGPWLNEIHYDDRGADQNEFIEIAGPAGIDLTNFSLVVYNNTGLVADTKNLSGIITNEVNGYGTVLFPRSFFNPGSGQYFQNNLTGFALIENAFGSVHWFLSYEGIFTAIDGPAAGLGSVNIGGEPPTLPEGLSLQLAGIGASDANFNWSIAEASPGMMNVTQLFVQATLNPNFCENPLPIRFSDTTNNAFGCPVEYEVFRTWSVDTGCAGYTQCIQTLTVTNNSRPIVDCEASFIAELGPNGQILVDPIADLYLGASTACGSQIISVTPTTVELFECTDKNTIHFFDFMVTDDCGKVGQCAAVVSVVDRLPPVITCPFQSITVECSSVTSPEILGMATAVDNCEGPVEITVLEDEPIFSLTCPIVEGYTRTFQATDSEGNMSTCSYTYFIRGAAPTIRYIEPIVVTNYCEDLPAALVNLRLFPDEVFFDIDCAFNSIFSSYRAVNLTANNCAASANGRLGQDVQLIYEAGNDCFTSFVTQTYFFVDTVAPFYVNDLSGADIQCGDIIPPALTAPELRAMDGCSGASRLTTFTITNSIPSCSGLVGTDYVYVVIDDCGNESYTTQSYHYVDDVPPTFPTIEPLIDLGCNLSSEPPIDDPMLLAFDNCGILTASVVSVTNFVGCRTDISRMWTAIDNCGNVTVVEQLITYRTDPSAPVLTCPSDFSIATCELKAPLIEPSELMDDCESGAFLRFLVEQDPLPGTVLNGVGPHRIDVTVSDSCGNTTECSVNIQFLCSDFGPVDPAPPTGPVGQYNPSVSLDKTVYQGLNGIAGCPGAQAVQGPSGEDVTFCFSIFNNGDTTLIGLELSDAQLPGIPSLGGIVLIPGQTHTLAVPSSIGGTITNIAEVVATPIDTNGIALTSGLVTDTDSAVVIDSTPIGPPSGTNGPNVLASIGDTLFVDLANTGSPAGQNIAAQGVAGVTINLYQMIGGVNSLLASTVTTAVPGNGGFYQFSDLLPGIYVVEVDASTIPAGSGAAPGPNQQQTITIVGTESLTGVDFPLSTIPTAITLLSFTQTDGIVEWTADETDILGYRIYGAESIDGERRSRSDLILATGGAYSIELEDADVFLWIEAIGFDLSSEVFGPAQRFSSAEPSGEPTAIIQLSTGRAAFTTTEAMRSYLLTGYTTSLLVQDVSNFDSPLTLLGTEVESDGEKALYFSWPAGASIQATEVE